MSENEPNVLAVDTPKIRCHGMNSITGEFEPCVDCPINWKLGDEK